MFGKTPVPKVKIISTSVQGASHKRANKDCQDSYRIREYKDVAVVAVADGHGSDSCPFSQDGAKFAAEEFCRRMINDCAKYADEFLPYLECRRDVIANDIVEKWRNHIKTRHQIKERTDGESGIWRKYGTTLLGLVITPNFYFALQIGDGDMLLISDNDLKSIVVADKILGVETHSMSRENAWENAATYIGRIEKPESLKQSMQIFMLSTDGFSNSYKNEEAFFQTCREYYSTIKQYGADIVGENLSNWLDETSEKGSGDDITVIFAVIGGEV